MSMEIADYKIISSTRENISGGNCAILGDCTFHYGTKETFATNLRFDMVETFDILGSPTHKVNLNEPIDSNFYDTCQQNSFQISFIIGL